MLKLTLVILSLIGSAAYSKNISSAKTKALEVTKTLAKFYSINSVNIKEIEEYKNGKPKTAVKSIYCNKKILELPSGNQEVGTRCTVGIGSGFIIDFDAKLNPIKISYFVP